MPLIEGKSKKSFEKNIKTEIKAGKDPKQAVAIAYSVKRRNMAKGGEVKKHVTQQESMQCENCGHHMAMGGNAAMAMGGKVHETEKEASRIGHEHTQVAKLAMGGNVNEKLNPHHQPPMDPRNRKDIAAMRAPGMNQTAIGKLAEGGLVDSIMEKRKKMAGGGAVESEEDNMPYFARKVDMANTHYLEDEEHDVDSNPTDDDHSLVGQIMSEREKKKRMGM